MGAPRIFSDYYGFLGLGLAVKARPYVKNRAHSFNKNHALPLLCLQGEDKYNFDEETPLEKLFYTMTNFNETSNRVNEILPAITTKHVSYNSSLGAFLTDGWTSAAGNTYGQLMYLSPRLAIVCDFGVGWAYTFLNGIKVLRFNGRKAELVDSRSYHCCIYDDNFVRRESAEIVSHFIETQMLLSGVHVSSFDVVETARRLVGDTVNYSKKQLGG